MPDTSPRPPAPRAPRVIVTRELTDSIMTRLEDLFDTANNRGDTPMTRDQLAAAMADCDVLVPTVTDRIDKAVLMQAGEQLKLIANFGNGVDNIDVTAALRRGPDLVSNAEKFISYLPWVLFIIKLYLIMIFFRVKHL